MLQVYIARDKGPRDYMEDRHCSITAQMGDASTELTVLGVFDGHGGSQVAEFVSKALPQGIVQRWHTDLTAALQNINHQTAHGGNAATASAARASARSGLNELMFRDAFLDVDDATKMHTGPIRVGTTACMAVLQTNRTACKGLQNKAVLGDLWVANAGDSRCVLRTHRSVVQMSADHKPETAKELARITASGGSVVNVGGVHRVMGNLSLSRSLGDWYMRPYVVPHPGVSKRRLLCSDRYLLIASDGLWDVMTSKEACDLVDKLLSVPQSNRKGPSASRQSMAQAIPGLLIKEARRLGSDDNITIVLGLIQ
jgi:protein phosphatase 2C